MIAGQGLTVASVQVTPAIDLEAKPDLSVDDRVAQRVLDAEIQRRYLDTSLAAQHRPTHHLQDGNDLEPLGLQQDRIDADPTARLKRPALG